MNRTLFFFAGGDGFWWALPPLIVLLVLSARAGKLAGWARIPLELGLVVAGAFVFLGGPPMAAWIYVLWVASIVWLIFAIQPRQAAKRWPAPAGAWAVGLLAAVFAAWEWPYLSANIPAGLSGRPVYVVGDSLSAGIAAEKRTWPRILREDSLWGTTNLSVAGAQLNDAGQIQAPRIGAAHAAVILLIGGNDLVKQVDPGRFRQDLDDLLRAVTAPDRLVVLVELPSIPGYRPYARIQREVGREHGVALIPRRYLARVFLTPEATVDGLHWSDVGHQEWSRLLLLLAGDER